MEGDKEKPKASVPPDESGWEYIAPLSHTCQVDHTPGPWKCECGVGHDCQPPTNPALSLLGNGSIWQCPCGKRLRLNYQGDNWSFANAN
jgi:hypothetical protein